MMSRKSFRWLGCMSCPSGRRSTSGAAVACWTESWRVGRSMALSELLRGYPHSSVRASVTCRNSFEPGVSRRCYPGQIRSWWARIALTLATEPPSLMWTLSNPYHRSISTRVRVRASVTSGCSALAIRIFRCIRRSRSARNWDSNCWPSFQRLESAHLYGQRPIWLDGFHQRSCQPGLRRLEWFCD